MGKAHETAKEIRKQPQHSQKERRTAKHMKKEAPGSLPFTGNHYRAEVPAL